MGDKTRELLKAKKRRGWYLALTLVLAVLVTAGVGGLFHQPAVAKTYQVTALTCTAEAPAGPGYAGYFVHTHNEDCFDGNGNLVCPLPEIKAHVHDETCYTTTVVQTCGHTESDGHQHTEACYTRVQGDLICEQSTEPVLDEAGNVLAEGHVHTDECFAWAEELSCGMEEGEGAHHHSDSCFEYVTSLSCSMPEIILHTHTDDCYQKNEDGSIYVDEDGNTLLICGLPEVTEHVHGPECFTVYELDDEEAGNTENTEGDGSGLIFLFPEEEEEEAQPAESANPEAETGDTDATEDGNADPAAGNTPDTDNAADARDTDTTDNTESTGTTDSTNDTAPNAEGEDQDAASGEEAPIAEEPHEVVYTGTRGAEKGGVTVLAEIPEGALDESAQLVLSDADESAVRKQILAVVNENAAEGEEREISSMLLMDIGFAANGEPAVLNGLDPIRVTLKAAAIRSMSAPKLFHLSGGTAQKVEDVLFDAEAGTAVFTAATFSPFAIVDLTGEDPAAETVEEAVSVPMPAQSFTGETEGVIVSVEAPEGAFPEGTTMVVSPVEMDDDTLSNVTGAVESSGEKKVVTAQAVDISFFDAGGTLIEPKLPIKVSMKSALVSESENVALVHLAETAAAETAENAETETTEAPAATTAEVVTDVQVVENPDENNEIQFESAAFSVYVLVETETITTNYITADGETYTITVTYGPEAGIPAGATLAVAEIPQDSEEYAAYLAQAQNAVKAGAAAGETDASAEPAEATEDSVETPKEAEAAEETPEGSDSSAEAENTSSTNGTTDRVTVTTARFFDITILDAEGNPVEPAAPVDVKIEYMEPAETAENYQVVHFGEETEVLNPAVSGTDGTASTFDFQASSFSVFGVVGTKTITIQVITAEGKLLEITVTYGPEAEIPDNAKLVVTEYDSTSEEYLAAWTAVQEKVEASAVEEEFPGDDTDTTGQNNDLSFQPATDTGEADTITEKSGSFSLVVSDSGAVGEDDEEAERTIIIAENVIPYTFGMTAFDLSIYDAGGNPVEPKAAVEVSILVKELPADVETDVLQSTLAVQHLNESTGELQVETVASVDDALPGKIEILEGSITADFTVESFSTYTITWGGGLAGTGISAISQGQYIIYARDAYNGKYYALLPQRNNNGTLNTVQLTNTNGVISYSGDISNLYWTYSQYNGSYRFSFRSGNRTYYLAAGNFGAQVNTSINGTSGYGNADTTLFGQYEDHLHAAGDTFLRCYNGVFQFIHDVSTGWRDRSQVFFAKAADTKTVTVHYGYMDGNTFKEFDELPEGAQSTYGAPKMVGDQLNVRYDIEGKDYVTTRINNPINGTPISPMLQTEANSAAYWRYRVQTINGEINEWQPFGTNDSDIYVIYRDTPTQKSYDDQGLNPEDLSAPATNKDVQNNGNGTYDVSLSVTGTSNSMSNKTHANVVIVLDTSSSMDYTYSENPRKELGYTRLSAAKSAICDLADQLFGFNTTDDPKAIEVAFVNFSHRVRNEQTMQQIYSGTNASNFKNLINATNGNGGTNYDTAIEAANSILWGDADPVYVIFVTDGDTVSRGYLEYDESGASDHASDWDGGTYYNHDTATYGDTYLERARSAAKLQVNKILEDSNNKFFSIGVFGNVQYLEAMGGTYLGQANEQAKIEEAFAKIIDEIALDLGYKDVTIHDGITAMTSTTLVNGSVDHFRYEITQKDGTTKVYANGTALREDYPYIGLAKYDETTSSKAVNWELGENYQLADGVTYKVIFTVWPSQEAYDLLADLNNGTKDYDALPDNVKSQIVVVEEKYYLKTNTYSKIDYTSYKTKDGQIVETNPVKDAEIKDPKGKMILDGTGLQMKKEWNDDLDPTQLLELLTDHLNSDKTDTTYNVVLRLWQDKGTTSEEEIATRSYPSPYGFIYKPTVTITNGEVTAATWPIIDVAIAPGVLVKITDENSGLYDASRYPRFTYGNTTYARLETGHAYIITEDNTDLHFELNTDVYHPMVVDGTLRNVKFGSDGSTITEISTGDTGLSTLTAANDLKGGLDIQKFVTAKDDMSDNVASDTTYFTYKIKLQKSEDDPTPVYTTPDQFNPDGSTISGSLGFRIFAAPVIPDNATDVAEDKSTFVFDGLTYKANRNSSGEIYSYTARGTIPSSGELTLRIRQSKLGGTEGNLLDRIRIVNIPAGTYYTVEEIQVPDGYTLIHYNNASGYVQANTQPTAEFWNKRTSSTVDLLKVDEIDQSKVLAEAEFSLFESNGTTPAKDADGNSIVTIKTDSDGKATIGKLGIGEYKLVETVAPKGYNLMSSPITIIVAADKVTYRLGVGQPTDAVKSADGLTWTITATNNPGVELPATGGEGTLIFSVLGTILILSSTLLILAKRKQEAYTPRH